ncbi:fluoride efflux transporter FluC [Nocardioides sp. P5_C9_2]
MPEDIDPDTSAEDVARVSHRRLAFGGSQWDVLLVISAGGALGSLARWGVGELVPWSGTGFPWATFIENVSGGFALGMLMVFVLDVWPPHRYVRPFLGVGLLGGYTTFSTYMLESRHLLVDGQLVTAWAYLGGSLLAGLGAVWLGIASARLATRGSPRRGRRRPSVPPENATAVPADRGRTS